MFSNSLAFGEWVILFGFGAIFIVPFWFIFKKIGFPRSLSIFAIIPLINIMMLLFIAFSEWPIERELKEMQRQLNRLRK